MKTTSHRLIALVNRLSFETLGPPLLAVLALLLPFETRHPLANPGIVQITDVEVILYAVLLVWGCGRLGSRWRGWSVSHTAVLLWAAIVIVSALCAPFERAAAVKFALRSLGGCALFFAAADFSTTRHRVAFFAAAIAAGAVISAAAGCLEFLTPSAAKLLSPFKTQPTMIGGYLRASGTFQYANIAAMYWEAAAPICLMIGLAASLRHDFRRWSAIAPWALLLIAEAIVLSMSRAAILSAIIIPWLCLMLARSVAPIRRSVLLACVLATSLPLVCRFAFSEPFRLRLRASDQTAWYLARYKGDFTPMTSRPGADFVLPLRIRNIGAMAWPSTGDHPVACSYHWEDPLRSGFIIWDGLRTALPDNVQPGSEVVLNARIQAPETPGHYVLQIDMVHEGATWFSLQNSQPVRIPVALCDPSHGCAGRSDRYSLFRPAIVQVPRRSELWHAAVGIWKDHPVLGAGPDAFRLIYGKFLGIPDFDTRVHSNNLYLEMLANLGILGALSLASIIAASAALIRQFWRRATDVESRLLMIGIGASMAAFYFHGFLDYFLEFTPTYGLFWLSMGLATGFARVELDKASASPLNSEAGSQKPERTSGFWLLMRTIFT